MLKAYNVAHEGYDTEWHEKVLVYAETEEQARRIGYCQLSTGPGFSESVAERAPEYDDRALSMPKACLERSSAYLREQSWSIEGESSCDTCGLYPMGLKKYAVCRLSNQCKVCGCDDGVDDTETPCDHREGFSCG